MYRRLMFATVCATALLNIQFVSDALGQEVASALVREGDALPGDVLGDSINSISNTAAARSSGYAFTVTTEDIAGTLFANVWGNVDGGPGEVLASEGILGDLEITGLEGFFGLSDIGRTCYGTTSTNLDTMVTGLDGVFRDNTLLLNGDDSVPSLPGYFSTFNSRPGITADGQPYWVGGITDVFGTGTADRVLFLGTDAVPVLRGGDPIMGMMDVVLPESLDFDSRFSACGSNYIALVDVTSGDDVMIMNGEVLETDGVLIRAGNEIPASAGGIGDSFDNFDFMNVTETGSYMVTGDSDGATATDEFVMIDGEIVMREGDVVGPGVIDGAIEGAFMNEDGNWAAIWDVDIAAGNVEALIFNGELLLTEGQPVDWNGDGVIDDSDQNAEIENFTGISALTMTRVDNAGILSIYFTADCDVNGVTLEGGFEVRVPGNPILLADLNDDGSVNLLDVAPFVKVLNSSIYHPAADLNSDNQVNLLDVDALITIFNGG